MEETATDSVAGGGDSGGTGHGGGPAEPLTAAARGPLVRLGWPTPMNALLYEVRVTVRVRVRVRV